MVSRLLRSCLPFACVTFACGPAAAPRPAPLELEDFTMAGVPADADSTEIRLSFGDPDSAEVRGNPYDAYTPILAWYYADFTVLFEGSAVPAGYLLTGAGERTLRGIRVGDPASRVLQLYGRPLYRMDPVWTYVDPEDADAGHVLEFLIENDTVARIHLSRSAR
jgi:hypothetical protein